MLLWLLLGIAETRSLIVCSFNDDPECRGAYSLDHAVSIGNYYYNGEYKITIGEGETDLTFPQYIYEGSVTITGSSQYTLQVDSDSYVYASLILENVNIVFSSSDYTISIDSGASVTFSSCVLGYAYYSYVEEEYVEVLREALQADGIVISGSISVDSSSEPEPALRLSSGTIILKDEDSQITVTTSVTFSSSCRLYAYSESSQYLQLYGVKFSSSSGKGASKGTISRSSGEIIIENFDTIEFVDSYASYIRVNSNVNVTISSCTYIELGDQNSYLSNTPLEIADQGWLTIDRCSNVYVGRTYSGYGSISSIQISGNLTVQNCNQVIVYESYDSSNTLVAVDGKAIFDNIETLKFGDTDYLLARLNVQTSATVTLSKTKLRVPVNDADKPSNLYGYLILSDCDIVAYSGSDTKTEHITRA